MLPSRMGIEEEHVVGGFGAANWTKCEAKIRECGWRSVSESAHGHTSDDHPRKVRERRVEKDRFMMAE